MAYKRTFKKAYRKGKKAYRFAKAHQSEAKQALALAKKVARMVNVEYKYDLTNYASTVPWTGLTQNLCNPAQGDGMTNRDGDSLKLARVSGRLNCQIHASATATTVRLILFRGKNTNGTDPAPGDILVTGSGLMFQNPKREDNKFSTKILYDKMYTLTQDRKLINFNWNFKLYGHVKFEPGSAVVQDGGLYLLIISNEQTNVPTLNYSLKTTFTDN